MSHNYYGGRNSTNTNYFKLAVDKSNKNEEELKEVKIDMKETKTTITKKIDENNDNFRNARCRSIFLYIIWLSIPTFSFIFMNYSKFPLIAYIISIIFIFNQIVIDCVKKDENGNFRNTNYFIHRLLWLNRYPNNIYN